MGSPGALGSLVTMTTKHLGPGSICPPLAPGVLRCYSMKYCPFAQRTRLVLLAKNIKHEVINVNLATKPGWLFEKNPVGKVPILEQDGKLLYESLITCEYLEDMYPNPPLYPLDPWQKAQDRLLIEQSSKVSIASYKTYFAGEDTEMVAKAFRDMQEGLDIFEAELMKRRTKFFGGEKPGMLDYMLWPWAERLPMEQELAGDFVLIPESRFPHLISWIRNMMSDPPVMETYLPLEVHMYFLTTFDGKTREIKRKEVSRL